LCRLSIVGRTFTPDDRSSAPNIEGDGLCMVQAINVIGHVMGSKTIAE